MAKRIRPSPTGKEIERITETINTLDKFNEIQTKIDFDNAYDDYLDGEKLKANKDIQDKVFRKFKQQFPSKIKEVPIKKVPKKKPVIVKPKPKFTRTGIIKGKVVRARRTVIILKGKQVIRFRDKKGRFVSLKK